MAGVRKLRGTADNSFQRNWKSLDFAKVLNIVLQINHEDYFQKLCLNFKVKKEA